MASARRGERAVHVLHAAAQAARSLAVGVRHTDRPAWRVKLRDPNFTRGALAALPDTRAPLILADQLGGSLVRDAVPLGGSYGIMLDSTRSQALMAAYELSQVGYEDLAYVEGGFNDWYEEAALGGELPAGEGRWPGDKEWFGYRQFRGNDPRKGYR